MFPTVTKAVPFSLSELKVAGDRWEFSGLASTFGNLDHTGDIVMRGAFDETLAGPTKRRFLWQHDIHEPIGVEQKMVVNDDGLLGTWKISKTARGIDAYELLKDGAVDSLSIGYIPIDFEYDDAGVRLLKAVDLLEVSLVSIPANDRAIVTQVKALIEAGLLTLDDKAEWTAAFINNLPDSSFAVILPGGSKDDEGKTTPRSLRKLPHHNAGGKLDMPHLNNALAREPQTDMPEAFHAKARAHLQAHKTGKAHEHTLSESVIDLDVPFDALLKQLVYGVTYGTTEAEALWARRADEGREPKDAHIQAASELLAAAEAASDKLRELLTPRSEAGADDAKGVESSADETTVELVESAPSADLSLRLELARYRLRLGGLLESAT